MTELAKQCLIFRARNRLTQKEMGQRCGVDRTLIIDIEKGRPVSAMTETKVKLVLEEDEK